MTLLLAAGTVVLMAMNVTETETGGGVGKADELGRPTRLAIGRGWVLDAR